MKQRTFFKLSFMPLLILIVLTIPAWADSYLVLSRSGELSGSTELRISLAEELEKAGMAPTLIRQHYTFLGAVNAELDSLQAENLKNERTDLLIIDSHTQLHHSELLSQDSSQDTPWHVLKAQPLQKYAAENSAEYTSVLIFVLDTGVDTDHPDLVDNLEMTYARHFYNAGTEVTSDDDVSDMNSHGSRVTGTIIGDTTGSSPELYVVPIKSADDDGNLSLESLSAACDYIMGLKDEKLRDTNIIINLSYNTTAKLAPDSDMEAFFDILLSTLKNKGILFIGSAGNGYYGDGSDSDTVYVYPTRNESSNYVATASAGSNGIISEFSHFGDLSVEVAAPGSSIYTTDMDGTIVSTPVNGTSFASPFIAGIAGLIWATEPSLQYWEVRNLLINTIEGKEISSRFIDDYRGTENDYLGLLDGMSFSSYEDEEVEVIAGKPVFPAIVAGILYGPSPANGEEHVAFDSSLEWNNDVVGSSFDLWFGSSDSTLELVSGDFTETSFSIAEIEEITGQYLSYNSDYYWRVDRPSSQGSVWRFTTITPQPYDHQPVDGATGQNTELTLSWTCDMENTSFDIYLNSDRNELTSSMAASGNDPELEITDLDQNTTYYWKVITHHPSDPDRGLGSSSSEGPILSFTTKEGDDPYLYPTGGGGGGCETAGFIPQTFLLLLPLFLMLRNKEQ